MAAVQAGHRRPLTTPRQRADRRPACRFTMAPAVLFGRGRRSASAAQTLRDNDAYHALQAVGGLLMTGPTGTNVNDLAMVLIVR